MKKLLLFISFFLFALCASAQIDKVIPNRPSPPRLVNDFTGTLTPEQVQALENKLVAYDDSTSSQIAIVIIPTTAGNSIEEVALEILRRWGVGSKTNNNGIVLLVAKNDHKIRIEVGYGLEGAIPDLTAKTIIDVDLTPNFREGNYYRGFDQATDDLIKAAAGEYKAPEGYRRKGKGIGAGAIIFLLILIFGIIGNIGGRGGGGMVSRRGYGGFGAGWILGSMMGGGSRGGGGWSGGGGGFGGFGGGGGGGGGASGGW
ncbi:MAG: TPM domain-containing protein [Bacteroidia bacterium]|nr:TPM domain-containing protein [Bacteroidia bacterium]